MAFKGKVVVITDSSSGVGAAAAKQFATLSANVVIVGRNEERLKNVAKAAEDAKGIKPLTIKADLTNDSDVRRIVDDAIHQFGQIDVLVNNASAAVMAKLQDGIECFDKMIATNLRSIYLLTSIAMPYLIKSKGNIVNVSSVVAMKPYPETLAYCVAKAGLDMFTKCVAKELAVHGIRVNSVNPGAIKTGFIEAIGFSKEQSDGFIEMSAKGSPLGYISTGEDVAEVIVFLASKKARSITGSLYVADNGNLLG